MRKASDTGRPKSTENYGDEPEQKQQQEEPRKPLIRILGETWRRCRIRKTGTENTGRGMFQHRRESQSPVLTKARNEGVSVLLKRKKDGYEEGEGMGRRLLPTWEGTKPGFPGAAPGSTAAHQGALQIRPDPALQHHPHPPKGGRSVHFPHGSRAKWSSVPLANPTLKVILYPPEQAMEKKGSRPATLPWGLGGGVGRGAPVFIFLPDSLGL